VVIGQKSLNFRPEVQHLRDRLHCIEKIASIWRRLSQWPWPVDAEKSREQEQLVNYTKVKFHTNSTGNIFEAQVNKH